MRLGVGETLLISLVGFCIVFLVLLLLIVVITVISTIVMKIEGTSKASNEVEASPEPKVEQEEVKPWDGKLQLIDCDEETAACIMAIISEETEIPLEELQFRRIQGL